jgi:LmbE family N-acetylglucosaminyl deacetylase
MPTLVCFHAHPDDECIGTGGTMAQAHAAGHRVVLVVATRGERGEIAPGVLVDGEALWERRIAETYAAAELLGVDRVEFLGYVDSGMMGEPENDSPYSFWTADVDAAARRLAAILDEESADVLTVYDDHGGYGHPDHIQVHRVGIRAAALAGTPKVLQGTMNRDEIARAMADGAAALAEAEAEIANETGTATEGEVTAGGEGPPELPDDFGSPESVITHAVDVSAHVGRKRDAMRAHASQIPPDSWFLTMEQGFFERAFGTEWFIETGMPRFAGEPMRTSIWD